MFNKYKDHHKILKFLNDKYFKHEESHYELYSFSLYQISKQINEKSLSKTEKILTELEEFDCLNFRKTNNGTYKISENGIKKYRGQFFLEKQKEHFMKSVKDKLSVTVSLLAILTFFITFGINQKQKRLDTIRKKEIKSLTIKLKDIENRLRQKENDILSVQKDTLN